ncbi:hypothetical protein QUB36_00710 [Microcoleus sp. AT8-B1]|uniref:hypothetical protein n=1 Tax=unclassified Microcoleus TaxID=2642155 RepID=UPI002FD6C3B7
MNPETKQVSQHMKEFGLHILGRAIYDATFSEITRPFAHMLSVVHAAHGAEILIKARIAEEHPLLIFKSYPKSNTTKDVLSIKELFKYGRTLIYSELPEVLWATTGYRIKELDRYQKFGYLRNIIVHFSAAPDCEASTETLKFALEVLDYIVQDFWGESLIYYSQEWDDVIISEGYLREQIEQLNIQVHPDTQKQIESLDLTLK